MPARELEPQLGPRVLPLRERPRDLFFVLMFSLFAFTSVVSDMFHSLGLLETGSFWAQANLDYAPWAGDVFLLADKPYTRVTTAISAFIYGPFYLVLVYAFVHGRGWIRIPAFLYAGAILHGMTEHTVREFGIGPAPLRPLVFWAFNAPYALVPLLLVFRMWRANPFCERARD